MNLQNKSSSALVCAIDLEDKSYFWLDVEMDRSMAFIENTFGQTSELLSALLDSNRLNVHDLLTLHANSRGTLVENRDEADVRFAWEDFVADYATVAEFMTAHHCHWLVLSRQSEQLNVSIRHLIVGRYRVLTYTTRTSLRT